MGDGYNMAAAPLPLIPQQGQQQGVVPSSHGANPNTTATPVQANPGIVPINQVQNNPYAAPTASGTPGVMPAGGVQSNGINWNDGSYTVTGDLKDTYGAGTGTAISQALQGLGTSTDAAVQATIANTQLAADKQYGNIQAQQAAAGITPNSSTAALAAGDFYSTVNSNLSEEISKMELGEEDTLISTLLGTGKAHGPDSSTWDDIMNGFSDWGQITTAIGQPIVDAFGGG